ncbi:M1 family metallopeptidase [Aureibaculum sp. A20]|uniref:M1 family metallopeptidase n=1 Tax=Aureibaculum flavum TaxID=2795986 RepID=A0ABS0WL28_9FLAO|nr:M1 family metallopeptidase [Aureibaculum flavum]MBJ2172639.1 M1 family metallopeptidase [Aureibaculum flavum]
MKKITLSILSLLFIVTTAISQEKQTDKKERKPGHVDISKFRQLKEELPTPNDQHTASGAPGHAYTQQQVDYVMNITIDDETQKLYGDEAITYHNNSKDALEYLWIQLDQNMRAPDSKTPDVQETSMRNTFASAQKFTKDNLEQSFPGGFHLEYVKDNNNKDLSYMVNSTMMRINLPKPLASGETFEFKIKWWYQINNYFIDGGRSGYEHFEKDDNNLYVIAQFFPRLAVYNNVEGWQNMQFWGRSEFALEFGNYTVNITVPEDHIVASTGVLQNPKDVLTKEQQKRLDNAKKSFDNPVIIATQKEAEKAEKKKAKKTKTWKFYAENVRDFGISTSRKFIWDAMAVDINGKTVMAYSYYPKEGNPLWEKHSTRVVANTLKEYSKYTFDYPYHKAISISAARQGMEYPQICWNYGRPKEDGTYSDRTRDGMIGVITHEVGHNFFPMIVNSDERQWTWMDEGINSFVEILAEYKYDPNFKTRSLPKDLVRYMSIDQDRLSPIMSQGDHVYNFGPNAYAKPAAGLWMLRSTIMGPELFDYAFKTYSKRWMFKHPTPADFFRTMEDASAMDLDWFWRGWFYTTDYNDVGIKEVKKYYLSNEGSEADKAKATRYGLNPDELVYFIAENDLKDKSKAKKATDITAINSYLKNLSKEEKKNLNTAPNYFYEVTFEKPGGLVLPLIVELTYEDGSKLRKQFPAEIWSKKDNGVKRIFASSKQITNIVVDPDLETADIDITNNSWPKKIENNQFEQFKDKLKN